MSHGSTITIEDLARQVSGPLWFQNFMYRDRGLTRSFAERAQAAGYRALVLTVDNQVLGQRERDLRNGFVIPPRVSWRSVLDVARAWPWALRIARSRLTFANYVTDERHDIVSLAAHIAQLLDPASVLAGRRLAARHLARAAAAQGRAPSGRGARGARARRRRRRSSPTTAAASSMARSPRSARCRPWSTRSPAALRCCSTAACGAAATWSRRWRSARAPA